MFLMPHSSTAHYAFSCPNLQECPFPVSHPGVFILLLSIVLNHPWVSPLLLIWAPIPVSESLTKIQQHLCILDLSVCHQGLPSPFLHCPSQRLLDRVVRRYAEVVDAGSIFMDHFTDRDKLRLLYTLAVNAHPIILQVLSDPHELPLPDCYYSWVDFSPLFAACLGATNLWQYICNIR